MYTCLLIVFSLKKCDRKLALNTVFFFHDLKRNTHTGCRLEQQTTQNTFCNFSCVHVPVLTLVNIIWSPYLKTHDIVYWD